MRGEYRRKTSRSRVENYKYIVESGIEPGIEPGSR